MEYTAETYRELFPKLTSVALRYLSQQNAEDLVQDVLVELWEKRKSLSFVHDLYAYSCLSVRNRCLDYLRRQAFRRNAVRNIPEWFMENTFRPASSLVEMEELQRNIHIAVSQLPARCRMVFMLSRMEGLSHKEISQCMDISVNTVECQMTIALRKLNEHLRVS